jgi:hypothetical protein
LCWGAGLRPNCDHIGGHSEYDCDHVRPPGLPVHLRGVDLVDRGIAQGRGPHGAACRVRKLGCGCELPVRAGRGSVA